MRYILLTRAIKIFTYFCLQVSPSDCIPDSTRHFSPIFSALARAFSLGARGKSPAIAGLEVLLPGVLLKTGRTFRGRASCGGSRSAGLEFRDEEPRCLTRRFFPADPESIIRVVLIRSESSGPRNARRHAAPFSRPPPFRAPPSPRFLVSSFRPACPR